MLHCMVAMCVVCMLHVCVVCILRMFNVTTNKTKVTVVATTQKSKIHNKLQQTQNSYIRLNYKVLN